MPNLMIGFPPSSESQVALATRRTPPFNRWAFQHVREIVPSADIPHDPSSLRPLPTTTMNTDNLRIPNAEGASLTLDEFLQQASTDALVVLRDGRVVIERYANGMGPRTPHILMSVSKSLLGLLTGILIDRGEIDPSNPLRPWCRKSPAPPTKEPAFAEWDSLPSPTDGRGENELGKASRRAPPTSAEQKQPPQSHMEPGHFTRKLWQRVSLI